VKTHGSHRRERFALLFLAAAALAGACRPASGPPIDPALPPQSMTLEPDVRDLVDQYVALVRAEPRSASAHGKLGLVYEANDLTIPAETSFANAAALDPAEPLWRYHRSVVLRDLGRADEANRLLVESAKELLKDAGVQHRLGTVLLELGDLPGAEAAFQRALQYAPEDPSCLVGLALVNVRRSEWSAAVDLCQRALARDPDFRPAHYALGLAYRGLGDERSAAASLALGADGKTRYLDDGFSAELKGYRVNLASQITEAKMLDAAGRGDQALATWARIARRHPDDKSVLASYGASLLQKGRTDEAVAQLKKSLALDEKQTAPHVLLAEALLQSDQMEEAQAHADRAVALGPLVANTHKTRARVLARRKWFEEAYQELRRAAELEPRDPVALAALSEISLLSGHSDEAISWCRKALELDPSSLPVRVNLARLTFNSGDAEAARIQVKELLNLAPDNPRVQALAADVGLAPR
jgi:tetratricopeptide (TPR) repeat protein